MGCLAGLVLSPAFDIFRIVKRQRGALRAGLGRACAPESWPDEIRARGGRE